MQQLTLVEIELVCCMLIAAGTGRRPDLLAVEGSFYYLLVVNILADLDTLARMDTRIFLPFMIIKSKYVKVKSYRSICNEKNTMSHLSNL